MAFRVSRFRFSVPAVVLAALLMMLPLVQADSGAQHQVLQTPPIALGTSGGNVNDISRAFCCSGTLGALVSSGSTDYILSNNHVLADSDTGHSGDPISQSGLIDVNCDASQAQTVAYLSSWVSLTSGANVDAAIAQVRPNYVDTSGAILDIGVPSSTEAPVDSSAIDLGVAKSGRTTGLTCSNITSINTDVRVQYQQGCNSGKKFWVNYTDQIVVGGSGFSAGGDSGSLIVTSDSTEPIGLLFAGSSTETIANRISDVTSALNVSVVGGQDHAVTGCSTNGGGHGNGHHGHGKPTQASFGQAMAAKRAYAHGLMADPTVLGVGVGASLMNPSQAVVVVYVERGRSHGPIPPQLNGVPIRIVRTGIFRAYGWNETSHRGCRLR